MFEKEKKNNNNIFFIAIIGLLVVISILTFFIGKNLWDNKCSTTENNTTVSTDKDVETKDLTITVINDNRCNDCDTSLIVSKLKEIPFISHAKYEYKDFADEWVEAYLKENKVKFLPAIVFSTNEINDTKEEMVPYLTKLVWDEFSLQVWSKFDPLAKRSDKWFLVLEKDKLESIKNNSFIKWNPNAKITWIEYSDLECPFCAKLHNNWTPKELEEKYWENLNLVFNHFPLDFHKNAKVWAEILECLWEAKWWDAFYALLEKSFVDEKSDKAFLIDEAVKLWANKAALETCLSDWKFSDKVTGQMTNWASTFWITWTPWNILINNETWEYEILSWAYPTDGFVKIIDGLLK